jgi:hypothetical protein
MQGLQGDLAIVLKERSGLENTDDVPKGGTKQDKKFSCRWH